MQTTQVSILFQFFTFRALMSTIVAKGRVCAVAKRAKTLTVEKLGGGGF